jgi:hypothetical protein
MNVRSPARSSPCRPHAGARLRAIHRILVAAVALCAACAAGTAGAEEEWALRSGRVFLHLNVDLLRRLGIDVDISGAGGVEGEDYLLEEPCWVLPILPGADLRFRTESGIVEPRGSAAGSFRLAGSLVLRDRVTGWQTRFDDLEVAHVGPEGPGPPEAARTGPLHLRSAGTRLVFCELRHSMFDFRQAPRLEIHYLNARITAAWARAMGRPDLAGWVIGMAEVRADAVRLSWTPPPTRPETHAATDATLDVGLGDLADIQEIAYAGTYPLGRVGLSMATTICNLGTVDVPWLAPMQEDHPVIHMALYRLLGGRLEQIGVSWMKHGFFALSNSQCTPCQHPTNGEALGVGCSDTYDVDNNGTRAYLGPRSEVNAYTSTWECTGSHFSGGIADCIRRHGSSGHGPLDHRLTAADADLANPGATYSYEARYLVAGDQVPTNNWGYRACTMSWNGAVWTFATTGPLIEGPALGGWGDSSRTLNVAPGDGEVLLTVKTTPLGGATWHYEYALLNLSSDRQVRSFSLPVSSVSNIANIGFHDNDGDAGNDWQVALDADSIRWQTSTWAQDPNAHALVFGEMVNLRFDADAPPRAASGTLGIFKPGTGSLVPFALTGPAGDVTGVADRHPARPWVLEIRPNPLRRSATIRYETTPGRADLAIYDAAGRRMRTLVGEDQGAGIHSVTWDGAGEEGTRVHSGIYYARLRTGAVTIARSLAIVD